MKRIIPYIITAALLLTGCNSKEEDGQVSETTESPKATVFVEQTETPETAETAESLKPSEEPASMELSDTEAADSAGQLRGGMEMEPLLSKKIDTSKTAAYMHVDEEYATELVKGKDGSCYYYRNEGEDESEKLVFYKNNGIKVCETTIEKSVRNDYGIESFTKYGHRFFLQLRAINSTKYDTMLVTVDTRTGEWKEVARNSDTYGDIIIYKDCFYCMPGYYVAQAAVTIYDLSGKRTKIKKLAPGRYSSGVQCIVDDKIYYVKSYSYGANNSKRDTSIMRCNLDGSKKEVLLQFDTVAIGGMKIDEDDIYFFKYGEEENTSLIKLPLYGGEIKEIADVDSWCLDLSADSIFFVGKDGRSIYKINKQLEGEPQYVAKIEIDEYTAEMYDPFYYADGHLMVQGYDKKSHDIMDELLGSDDFDAPLIGWVMYYDMLENYREPYYWMREDGTVEEVIEGSGVKKEWLREYRRRY